MRPDYTGVAENLWLPSAKTVPLSPAILNYTSRDAKITPEALRASMMGIHVAKLMKDRSFLGVWSCRGLCK